VDPSERAKEKGSKRTSTAEKNSQAKYVVPRNAIIDNTFVAHFWTSVDPVDSSVLCKHVGVK